MRLKALTLPWPICLSLQINYVTLSVCSANSASSLKTLYKILMTCELARPGAGWALQWSKNGGGWGATL